MCDVCSIKSYRNVVVPALWPSAGMAKFLVPSRCAFLVAINVSGHGPCNTICDKIKHALLFTMLLLRDFVMMFDKNMMHLLCFISCPPSLKK
jgi:hypothetical protein